MNPFRRQLPVHSPLPLAAVAAAVAPGDARETVEAALRRLYRAEHVLLTDSGTSALALAIRASLQSRPGSLCALPAYGCFDLASAALASGARVALYDLDPVTLAPREESLERAVRLGCSVIVIVHHYGVPVPMTAVRNLAARSDAIVIEDAAQASGSRWFEERVGSGAEAAVLSFGRGKGVTAGSGGALLMSGTFVNRLVDAGFTHIPPSEHARLRFSGMLFAQWLLARPSLYGIPAMLPFLRLGQTLFVPPTAPRRMASAAARVLRITLDQLDTTAAIRAERASRLRTVQKSQAPSTLTEIAGPARPGWLRLPFLAPENILVDRAQAARLGVMPSYPSTLGALAALKPQLDPQGPMNGASTLVQRLWTIPTHGALTESDLRDLELWITKHGNGDS